MINLRHCNSSVGEYCLAEDRGRVGPVQLTLTREAEEDSADLVVYADYVQCGRAIQPVGSKACVLVCIHRLGCQEETEN